MIKFFCFILMVLRICKYVLVVLIPLTNMACGQKTQTLESLTSNSGNDTLTVAAGCFWCVEAPFEQLKGVVSVESGYMGGSIANPSYEMVCTGTTGHAEAVRIIFDTNTVAYETLMEVFFTVHDPTQLNRQGADVGTQYRSAIFYKNETERLKASKLIEELDASAAYSSKIMTKLEPIGSFYSAENYHQDYFQNNENQPYCRYVIQPKMEKFKKVFEKYLEQ
jgi:methionine-S-sulfoxide reductase